MIKEFNTYIDGIPLEFWRDLCREEGELKQLKKGEYFVTTGEVSKYLGYIESGSFKYVAYTKMATRKLSDLNITPIYLSRIRKKLKDGSVPS